MTNLREERGISVSEDFRFVIEKDYQEYKERVSKTQGVPIEELDNHAIVKEYLAYLKEQMRYNGGKIQ